LKVIEVKENLVKSLLHNIFGILPILRYSSRHGKNSPFVTKNQAFESLRIPTPCGSHQRAVGVLLHTRCTKRFHDSLPPRRSVTPYPQLERAIVVPEAVGDERTRKRLTEWGMRQFQGRLGSVSGHAKLSECWHAVHCAEQAESRYVCRREC